MLPIFSGKVHVFFLISCGYTVVCPIDCNSEVLYYRAMSLMISRKYSTDFFSFWMFLFSSRLNLQVSDTLSDVTKRIREL
jgi:hypothetical protein